MNVSPVGGLLLAAAVLGLALPGPAADKRKITETDLFRFVWVADPRISPDGKRVAFVRVTVNAKKEGYDTAVWIVPTDAERARPGLHRRPPRLVPALVARRPDPGLPAQRPQGRQAGAAADPPDPGGRRRGAQRHRPAAGRGRTRLVARRSHPRFHLLGQREGPREEGEEQGRRDAKDADKKDDEDRESDVRVITRSVYRFDGAGYADDTRPGHAVGRRRARRGPDGRAQAAHDAATSTRTTWPSHPTAPASSTPPTGSRTRRTRRPMPTSTRCRGRAGRRGSRRPSTGPWATTRSPPTAGGSPSWATRTRSLRARSTSPTSSWPTCPAGRRRT